jgi:mono/diheme cytochrome c family protein
MAVTAVALGPFVLPRVGQDATVTTFFEDDLRAAEALRDLQRAADRDGSVPSLMRLADAYWHLQDAPQAEASYRRVLLAAREASGAAPVLAYQRLALLTFGEDPATAREYLLEARRLDPHDPDTLVGIAELSFQLGELDDAREAYGAYLETPDGQLDVEAAARLRLIDGLAPVLAALEQERNASTLNALADVLWDSGAMDQAVEVSFEILTAFDPRDAAALSRTGQLMFLRGRSDDAIELLERAAASAGGLARLEPQASLFLGNAYFSRGDDEDAVRAWRAHVELVGAAAAGRVPELIETALARAAGEDPERGAPAPEAAAAPPVASELTPADRASAALAAGTPDAIAVVAEGLFAHHCALCHGAQAQGGSGPRLAGNSRAAQEANVRSAISFGRGIMPGFGAILDDAEIEALVRWLAVDVASPR